MTDRKVFQMITDSLFSKYSEFMNSYHGIFNGFDVFKT